MEVAIEEGKVAWMDPEDTPETGTPITEVKIGYEANNSSNDIDSGNFNENRN